jgi:pilus assembly protein TadC
MLGDQRSIDIVLRFSATESGRELPLLRCFFFLLSLLLKVFFELFSAPLPLVEVLLKLIDLRPLELDLDLCVLIFHAINYIVVVIEVEQVEEQERGDG